MVGTADLKLLEGQVGNGGGVTTGAVAVGGGGKQRFLDGDVVQRVRRRVHALHLVEHHALVPQLGLPTH